MGLILLLSLFLQSYGANQCLDLFVDNKAPTFTRTYENSGRELRNSYELLSQSVTYKKTSLINKLFEWKNQKLIISDQLKTETQIKLVIMHAVLVRATTSIGLSSQLSHELGFRLQKEICQSLKLNWTSQQASLNAILNLDGPLINKKQLLLALEQINQLTEVNHEFQVPYLAGYSKADSSIIYIDSGLPVTHKTADKEIPLIPFLVIHERIEKALMDTTQLDRDVYLATHQVAQRIEKMMLVESGYSWHAYQKQVMGDHIKRAGDPKRSLERVPADLDLTPYQEAKDTKTIEKMQQAMQTQDQKTKLFDLKITSPGVVHLMFHDQIAMAWTMMRFQEFYESPRFRGKLFSRKEFLNWFYKKQDGFKTYSEWDGFNVPNEIFKTFFTALLPDLTKNESLLLDRMKNFKHAKFYVVATAGNEGVLRHELAHARFYFDETYRRRIVELLGEYNLGPVLDFLRTKASDYHEAVLIDEAHAWLMNDSIYMQKEGFDIKPYQELIKRLNEEFEP